MTTTADTPTDDDTHSETDTRSNPDGESTDESAHCTTDNEPVDPETRKEVLEAYNYRCQICGRRDPDHGGFAALQVHHIEREPDGMDEHDIENLTLLCTSCHTWIHNRSTIDDSPVELCEEDRDWLLPQDIEILEFLSEHGPARTGEIADAISVDQTVTSIRKRLWALMGLDNLVESRDRQLIDKDVETGEWGLTGQIETTARGHIPEGAQQLYKRIEDELVRQALERGFDRETVADVFNTTRRTTFTKQKRANAIDFPIDAINRGGRPAKSHSDKEGSRSENSGAASPSDRPNVDDTTTKSGDGESRSSEQQADETESLDDHIGTDTDSVDEFDEVWDEHHSALHPIHRNPEIVEIAKELDPDELSKELPDGIDPVQLLNAFVIASQT